MFRSFHLSIAVFVLATLAPRTGAAKFYQLFTAPGVQVAAYTQIVQDLKVGDELGFSDGKRVEVTQLLGNGATTKILGIGPGRAVRIPLKSGSFDKDHTFMDYIDNYVAGHARLKARGAAVLDVYPEESLTREYATVEQLNIQFTYEDFLSGKAALTAEQRTKVEADFVRFARTTWGFSIVGDQHTEQIAYTDKGWLFLDFNDNHKPAMKVESGTIFTRGYEEIMADRFYMATQTIKLVEDKLPLPPKLHRQVLAAIATERVTQGMTPPFSCSKFLTD